MKRDNAGDGWSQCRWHRWIALIGDMARAFHFVAMNFSLECRAYLPSRAVKIDDDTVRINLVDMKAVQRKPGGDRIDVLLRYAESFAKLIGSEPTMVVR